MSCYRRTVEIILTLKRDSFSNSLKRGKNTYCRNVSTSGGVVSNLGRMYLVRPVVISSLMVSFFILVKLLVACFQASMLMPSFLDVLQLLSKINLKIMIHHVNSDRLIPVYDRPFHVGCPNF